MTNVQVNKKHYYFSCTAKGKIVDAHFADYTNRFEAERIIKDTWAANFRLYTETENILQRIQDPDCALFPLYRGLGLDDEDFIFATREEAEKEYTDHINQSIADRFYDL